MNKKYNNNKQHKQVSKNRYLEQYLSNYKHASYSGLLLDNDPEDFPKINIAETYKPVNISEMFDYKYKEDVENLFYQTLEIEQIQQAEDVINVKSNDYLIDLSPCIGVYCEACFFKNYNIDKEINLALRLKAKNDKDTQFLYSLTDKMKSIEEKILILTSIATNQDRYRNQVEVPFVSEDDTKRIIERLSTEFDKNALSQLPFSINIEKIFKAVGYADTIKNGELWELKFISELSHEHFLQLASYVYAQNSLQTGVLWNVKNNEKFKIKIKDRKLFYKLLVKTITKGKLTARAF